MNAGFCGYVLNVFKEDLQSYGTEEYLAADSVAVSRTGNEKLI